MPVSRLRRRCLSALGLLPALGGAAPGAAPVIRHALVQLPDGVPNYELAVLRLLLERTQASHGPYRLEVAPPMTQSRAFLQLAAGDLDLTTSVTTTEHEAQALAVRTCLYRGLIGIRLPIALARRRAELQRVATLEQARQLRLAQVESWPDTQILKANGWPVQAIARRSSFPALLERERIDLFALGAIEVYPFVDALPGLCVLDGWLIAYPAPLYFFVSPGQPELAARLRKGWELVLADGSFTALFEQWAGPQLQRAALNDRRWLKLHNPDLPTDTPLQDDRLWHPLVAARLRG
ncbi:hypothetical protein J2X20_004762 [Pelomonas saccharophila]|uniref:Solute-binding protein family 3/N-terminal domain-containing protein n=1 Tax=Roseateles saccharophilus TaxID=304 RepID=A0ABU1YTA0_ROSSA|nr:hypothetical protein [Roseateles saccharophilus]MDR7272088.1 hypothetical protein [Roseateles saccharophilus]